MPVAGMLAVAAAALVAVINASPQAKSGTGATQFEVATVKPLDPFTGAAGTKSADGGAKGRGGVPFEVDHGRLHYEGTLHALILRSYRIQGCLASPGATCPLLSGGPAWVNKDIFEIQAKAPEGTQDYTFGANGLRELSPELQFMLQALLADRFNLKVHRERKQLPLLALTVAKNGPKPNLKKGAGEMIQRKDGSLVKDVAVMWMEHGPKDPSVNVTVKNLPMQEFVDRLSPMMGRLVLDRTELKGEFTFTMDYEKDPDAPPGNLSLVGPSMFTAFQEQLGLKLESTKAPVEVLVIDHAEQPSAN
jgi:uncharacterized protein (TIGR03435 family)